MRKQDLKRWTSANWRRARGNSNCTTTIFCEGIEVELDQFVKLSHRVSERSSWPEDITSFAVEGFPEII